MSHAGAAASLTPQRPEPLAPVVPGPRVVFLTKCLEVGGTEMHLQNLILRTPETIWSTVIVCLGPDVYSGFFEARNRRDVTVRQGQAETFLGYFRLIKSLGADAVVFVNGKFDLFPWWALAAARLAAPGRLIGLEHLQANPPMESVKVRGVLAALRRLLGWRTRYMLARRAAGHLTQTTICVSDAVRRTLVRDYGYPAERAVTIHNGIDLAHYRRSGTPRDQTRARLGIPPDDRVLVYVTRLAAIKRVELFLGALALVRVGRPTCRGIVVGSGPLETQLRAEADRLGLGASIEFAGLQHDVRPYLEAADVYVSSSDREGLPLSVAEAMALELPCVATNIGGHDEVLGVHGTGILVPPGSAAELATAIGRLLDHPAEAREIGQRARQAAMARFDIERMVARFHDLVATRR